MIIEVEDLVKHYGEVKALDGVPFSIEEGEIFGLLDPNGAGKTTLMEIFCGLRRFDTGKVAVQGFDLVKDDYQSAVCLGFAVREKE